MTETGKDILIQERGENTIRNGKHIGKQFLEILIFHYLNTRLDNLKHEPSSVKKVSTSKIHLQILFIRLWRIQMSIYDLIYWCTFSFKILCKKFIISEKKINHLNTLFYRHG